MALRDSNDRKEVTSEVAGQAGSGGSQLSDYERFGRVLTTGYVT